MKYKIMPIVLGLLMLSMSFSVLALQDNVNSKKHDWSFGTDLNKDGAVDVVDLLLLVDNLGKTGHNLVGDFNHDNRVNMKDVKILSKFFGKTISCK